MVAVPGVDNAFTADVGDAQIIQLDAPAPPGPGQQSRFAGYVTDSASSMTPTLISTLTPKVTRWPGVNRAVETDLQIDFDDEGFHELDFDEAGQREILIYRNGKFFLRLKPMSRRGDTDNRVWNVNAKDHLRLFQERYIGRLRTDFLINGSFESSGTGWTAVGASMTDTFPTSDVYHGTRCLQLVSATPDALGYYQQDVVMHAVGNGLAVSLIVNFRIDDITQPAPFTAGISLERVGAVDEGGLIASEVVAIDRTTHRHVWETRTLLVTMPIFATETLRVKLFCPSQGTIRFDACRMVIEESIDLSTDGPFDKGSVVSRLGAFVQGRGPYAYLAPEKGDMHVNMSIPNTGKTMRRVYQLGEFQKFYDGGDGYGVLDEILRAPDTLDVRLIGSPNSKTLVGYTPNFAPDLRSMQLEYRHYPGTPEIDIRIGITKVDWGDSIESAKNDVTLLGGQGTSDNEFVTREEANYRNDAPLGGLILEAVESAPDGARLPVLQDLADSRGAQLENPVVTPTLTLVEPRDRETDEVLVQYVGVVVPGAVISPVVIDGGLRMSGDWKVVSADFNWETEELTVVVNPA